MRQHIILLIGLLMLAGLACRVNAGLGVESPSTKPKVATSIHPLSLLVTDIAGDWLDVRQLLANNQEPHHVALTISQRRLLDEADLIVWVGPELETFLVRALSQQGPRRVISLDEVAIREGLAGANTDPHLWLNPPIVKAFYRQLATLLTARFPQHQQQIADNLANRLAALDHKLAAITERLQGAGNKAVIVDHQAYSHFTRYFGIQLAGALVNENGVAGGARSFAELSKANNVACVVVEQLPAPQRARKLAAVLGVKLVAIDPLGVTVAGGYLELLENLAQGFEDCLSGP